MNSYLPRRSGVVHAQGICTDCGQEFDHWKNALALSAQHARRTGHEVKCEQAVVVTYNPKPVPSGRD